MCIYCCLADLQMAGDMEQQIPVISVPMPGKKNNKINVEAPILSACRATERCPED